MNRNAKIAKELVKLAKMLVAFDAFETVDEFNEYMKDPSHKAKAVVVDKYNDGLFDESYAFSLRGGDSIMVFPEEPVDDMLDGTNERMTLDQFVKFAGYSNIEQLIDDHCISKA